MVMKKVLASVMAVATLALAIAGCGKKDDKKAFFNACKIYSDWEKAKKNKAEENTEVEAEAETEAE
jgi:hypothetical protein